MYNNNDCYPDHGDPYSPGNGGASGPGITGNSGGNTSCGSGCDGSCGSGDGGSQITYVNSVVVCPQNITLKIDTYYYEFCASVLPTNASNQNLRWESADPCIASVNGSGDWICANNIGTTTIYANATDGSGCRGYLTVTVSNTVAATSVILSTYHLKLKLGQQSTVSATVLPLTATNRGMDWTSSDPGIATVEDGVITACAVGSAKIYATAADGSGRRAVCSVTVTDGVVATSISVRAEESALLVGKSTRCWASVCPEEYDDSCVTWSSDDPCVASVSLNDGIVLALSAGVATIRATATDGSGVSGTVQIRVSTPILAEFITVCPETLTLDVGDTVGLFADICPANATSKRIRWTSDDSYIASVDAVSGCVTAESEGSTRIHAHAQDGSEVSAYCEVVVNACYCSTNTSMETARDIDIESLVSGTINDSDGEQWFKFTVPQTAVYTIHTTGSLDTIGYLYDVNGNIITSLDDHAASGKLNFRIVQELQANQTYYIRVTEATASTGNYFLQVTQKTLVDSISVNPSQITLDHIGKVYELPILPNTFVGIENAEPLSILIASTIPSSANEKRVTWLSFDHDIIRIDTGSYNGQTYQTLTVLGTGTAKLYAWDWNDDGKRGECTVNAGGGWPVYAKPTIHSRDEWEAKDAVTNRLVKRERQPERIIFHHPAKPFSSTNISDIKEEIKRIQNRHIAAWDGDPKSDIAYHFLIDPAGGIWQGAEIDEYKRGHAEGHFDDIGVCILGNFEPEKENDYSPNILNDYQKNAMKELSKWLCYEYDLKFDTTDDISPITTHRSVDSGTLCPGANAAPWIESDLRNYIIEWYYS